MSHLLDIIVPHAREGWEICHRIFDMLRLQLCADMTGVRVIVVHDGGGLWPSADVRVPGLEVEQLRIPASGVSAARNFGLGVSDAEWVMFCDCDDTFAHVWSMHCILDALRSPGAARNDLLWFPFYVEENAGRNLCGLNWIFVHGKIYRRAFLEREKIRFWEALYYAEDSAFNACVEMALDPGRIGEIKADAPLYVWVFNRQSVTSRPENQLRNALGLMDRHILVTEEMIRRGRPGDAAEMAARASCDGDRLLARPDIPEAEKGPLRAKIEAFRTRYAEAIATVPPERMAVIREASRREHGGKTKKEA